MRSDGQLAARIGFFECLPTDGGEALKLPEDYVYQVAIALGHKATAKAPHEYSWEKNVTCL